MPFYNRTAAVDIELKNGDVLRVNDLRVQFEITKSKDEKENDAQIMVYNLSEDTRSRIRENDALVRLSAGHEQDIGNVLIFVGNSINSFSEWQTPDIVTKIEAKDGHRSLRETRSNVSFQNKVSANTVVARLADDLGFPLRVDFDIQGSYDSFSFSGQAKVGLTRVLDKYGYIWSVVDGELQIIRESGNNGSVAVLLSSATGLINTPERISDKEGKLEESFDKEFQWKITSILNPRLSPGSLVDLRSNAATGIYQIETVTHRGDTRGSEWYSEIEVKPA